MRHHHTNPIQNDLPKGLDESTLVKSIELSGYPLQGIVASKLSEFSVSEEWGYLDRESGTHRSLDIFAFMRMQPGSSTVITTNMSLLIECKRSRHPLVFFQNVTTRSFRDYPSVAGFPQDTVRIEDSYKQSIDATPSKVLGLDESLFLAPGPPVCSSFARASVNGQKVELTGEVIFRDLILPLISATEHTRTLYKYRGYVGAIPTILIIPIAVIDAPMLLVESPQTATDPVLIPWVRVIRQESPSDPSKWAPFRFYGIEIVHVDYFEQFLKSYLHPLCDLYADRAISLADVIWSGGIVDDLNSWKWNQIRKTP